MGKNLKGRELGKGIVQRKDGRRIGLGNFYNEKIIKNSLKHIEI